MRNSYFYEWCVEEWEYYSSDPADYDIQDHDFADSLKEYAGLPGESDKTKKLCLIWHEGNDDDGEIDRGYAYVKYINGVMMLPDIFTDTGEDDGRYMHDVPKKYKEEIRKAQQ